MRYAVNCSMLFTEFPLLERAAAATSAGFDGVEFWWPFAVAVPPDDEVDAFVTSIADAGAHLVGLNFFAGDMGGGDRGLVSWPGRDSEFLDSVDVAIGIAAHLDCRAFNALYGNRVDGFSAQQQDELAIENLSAAGTAVAAAGGTVLIESVSGAPRYPLLTAADALGTIDRVADRTGVRNLGFLADLYHLAVNGDDLDTIVHNDAQRIAHVQIADSPGRHEPGTGLLPLQRHLDALEAGGYRGWVGLEYTPTTDSMSSFDWVRQHR
ncbi:hydroxypyruvate isomerase family protein [Compostimonas suwonensis]|uniref:hydroxypyruvate isomerase family protein n=1 Tax=Compostimonas suwonensis TaxID=1048394 RepID=UPI001B80072E|nr:TIM barrel protein [Compostimonas suwonensis]